MGKWNRFDCPERSLRWKTGWNEQPRMVFADWNQECNKLIHNQSLFEPFIHEASAFLCQKKILRFYNIIYFYYKFDYILHLYIIFYLIIFLICGVDLVAPSTEEFMFDSLKTLKDLLLAVINSENLFNRWSWNYCKALKIWLSQRAGPSPFFES